MKTSRNTRITNSRTTISALILSTLTMMSAGSLRAQDAQPTAAQTQIQAQQLHQQQRMRGMAPEQRPLPAGQPSFAAGQATYAVGTPYFTAYRDGRSDMVIIQWQLSTELNTDRYLLERSTDTMHFSPMEELVARGGPGAGPNTASRTTRPWERSTTTGYASSVKTGVPSILRSSWWT
ncbi:MAG: hypothetical protein Q8927_19205 [Bacteroidota bacterium]|nr:hypothetical protein [Bacteroidota bacterium]MDP4247568.1 hypothetical protein [Bacteroidota bacterium]MDP4255559.1 hypothetical protein [Bacteroidota bacterium]